MTVTDICPQCGEKCEQCEEVQAGEVCGECQFDPQRGQTIWCPDCDGEGKIERLIFPRYGIRHELYAIDWYYERCNTCDGKRRVIYREPGRYDQV